MSRAILRWIVVLAWAAFIFYMSSRTSGQLSTGILGQIKEAINQGIGNIIGHRVDFVSTAAHFCEYTVLAVLLIRALPQSIGIGVVCCMAVVLASLYGVTDEFHQMFVDGRYCDVYDWITDTAGAAMGAGITYPIARRHS